MAKRRGVAASRRPVAPASSRPVSFPIVVASRRGGVAMYQGREWRVADKQRRRAIHVWIDEHRDELLKRIPQKSLGDKQAKRNELVRLGRQQFSALPRSVQDDYLERVASPPANPKAGKALTPPKQAKRKVDDEILNHGADFPCAGVGRPPKVARGPYVEAERQDKSCQCELGPAALRHKVPGRPSVELVMLQQFPFVQSLFPGALAFDVVAAAIRLLETLAPELQRESDRVKAALVLGVGAKLVGATPSRTRAVWKHFVTPRVLPHMVAFEAKVIASWAKRGL